MFQSKLPLLSPNHNGFYAPPASRPPTKGYDRDSYVLVVSKNDEVLKFMKVHLNRYFSHVVVHKSYTEGFAALKEREYDLALVQANPQYKPTMEFLKRMGSQHRSVPVVIIDPELTSKAVDFPGPVVVGVVAPPFDLDALHSAIRIALDARPDLKVLHTELAPRSNIGDLIRTVDDAELPPKSAAMVASLRKKLGEGSGGE